MIKRIGLLLSGGIDSTALAMLHRPTCCFVVDYGQLAAEAEVTAAKQIGAELGLTVHHIAVNCRELGAGTMAGGTIPPYSPSEEWWPYRNQLLATLVAPMALAFGLEALWFASVLSDGFHADGRAEFYEALDRLFSLQEGGLRVSAPMINLTTTAVYQSFGLACD